MSIAEMDIYFIWVLSAVQKQYWHIIPDVVNVDKAYSVYRSLCCGATLEALNVGILEAIINIDNKWRKKMRANRIKISMSEVAVPTLIKYSSMLPG